MNKIKVATFNAEWMTSIFGGKSTEWDGTIHQSFPGRKIGPITLAPIGNVPNLCKRIASVIQQVDPDFLGIEEGPPLIDQMKLFVRDYLNNGYAVFQSNKRDQSIFMLVRKSHAQSITQVLPDDPELALLKKQFNYYPWIGYQLKDRKKHSFYRIPLVLKFKPEADTELQFVVVHTKSEYSLLQKKEQWEKKDKVAVLDALDARQKLSAEVCQLRRYIDGQLPTNDPKKGLVVMGDFNDGPFQDQMEEEFLLHSILDELVGSFLKPNSHLTHAMDPVKLAQEWTIEFPDPMQDDKPNKEIVDHILVSPSVISGPDFSLVKGSCIVEHNIYNNACAPGSSTNRELRPSDHRPVSAVIEY
ncbi:MAG: hypothetical protein ABSB63_02140 [Spirochaetia bacterium]|jgi:endonuclease/exonuclease/phosphatase family metal-dependent hydrolase